MVPNGWSATQFGELADFKSGGTPSKQNANYWGGDEPWISGKDLKSHYLSTSIDRLTIEGFSIAKKTPLGSTLILVRGMTLLKDFPVGYTTKEVAFNQDIKALLAKSNIDGLFLSFLLVGNKHKIKNLVTTAGHGTGRLDTESLKAFPVDLPPLPEQRKIAQILSTWDRGIATTEKLIDASKQQKKALMQQLLTGKKRLVDPETGKAFEGEWEEVKLGEILKIGSGKDYKHLDQGNVPVYGTGGYMLSVSDYLYDGDSVCIGRKGTIDKPMLLTGKFWTVDTLFFTHSFNQTTPQFIYQYFLTINWKKYNEASGVPSLSKSIIEKISIKIPTLEEQQKIASVLIAADKEIELLKAKLAHFKQEKKALMQQLLTGKRRVKVAETEAA